MKLYYTPGACSMAVHIVLEEAGLPYDLERINLRASPRLTADGRDFRTINPRNYVPALALPCGTVLTEAAAIMQYVADLVPGKGLVPRAGTLERAQLAEWLNFIATEIHKGTGPLWDVDGQNSAGMKQRAWARLRLRLDDVETRLAGRDYLNGSYSVADAYLFTCLGWLGFLHHSLDRWPRIKALRARVFKRPAVQAAMTAEGLLG